MFVAVIDAAPSYRPGAGAPSAWLFGIARSVVSAEHRRERERRTQADRGHRLLEPDDVARVLERIDAEACGRELFAALADLPDSESAVFELTAPGSLTPAGRPPPRSAGARSLRACAGASLRSRLFDDGSHSMPPNGGRPDHDHNYPPRGSPARADPPDRGGKPERGVAPRCESHLARRSRGGRRDRGRDRSITSEMMPSADAVQPRADGCVSVRIGSLSEAAGLQRSVRAAGVPAVVDCAAAGQARCLCPDKSAAAYSTGTRAATRWWAARVGTQPGRPCRQVVVPSKTTLVSDGTMFTIEPGNLEPGGEVYVDGRGQLDRRPDRHADRDA